MYEVAGDFYDFYTLPDGRLAVVIADVSGKGVPAALFMALSVTVLRFAMGLDFAPGELMDRANQAIIADQQSKMFATVFAGYLDLGSGVLQFASGGHNPPLLVDRCAKVRELDCAQSYPLGVDVSATFELAEATLESGDTLMLYTDGITEATSESGELYGRDRLLSCVCEDVPNAQHIIDCITHRLLAYTGKSDQDDDQTLLALRVR